MSASAVPHVLTFGVRPRASVRVLVVGFVVAVLAVSLRFAAPSLLSRFGLTVVIAAAGFLLAVVAGRGGGGVLAAILAAALPVFAFDAAATAVAEPVTFALIAHAANGAAWYTLGVAGLLAGPFGYAVGAATRLGEDSVGEHVDRVENDITASLGFSASDVRDHLRITHAHYSPLLVWGLLTVGAIAVWLVVPISATPSSVAAAPVLVAGGIVVATFLGYRARGAPAAVVAGGIGGGAGVELFVNGFSTAGTDSLLVSSITAVLTGFILGVPFGLVGYAIGRSLRTASRYCAEIQKN